MFHNMHVASVCFKCLRCFICMLQLFYLNVAKVDLNVTYVLKGYTCVSSVFKCFVSVSDNQTYVCKCFNCFRRML
jgi:hypothetical protein